MQADDNIKYIAIGNLVTQEVTIEYAPKREKLSKFREATKMMIDKLLLISISANERHTESMNEEFKFLNVVDRNVRWAYITIIKKDFPERIGYQLLSELENKTLNTLNTKFFGLKSNPAEVKTQSDNIQLSMVELYRKYKDPTSVDRLLEVQRNVNEIQKDMKENIKKVVSNIDNAKTLELQSEKLKLIGENYKKNANDLMKNTRWANWKMKLAVGGISGTFIGGLIYMFLK